MGHQAGEQELERLLDQGLISKDERDALHRRARREGRTVAELLRQEGLPSKAGTKTAVTFDAQPTRTHHPEAANPVETSPHQIPDISDPEATLDGSVATASPTTEESDRTLTCDGSPGQGSIPSRLGAGPVSGEKVSGRIGERYDLVRFLGRGGMGVVYHAFDIQLKRPIALKFLKNTDPELLERFIREARAQAVVDHENVCKVFEVGEIDGEPFISMQLIRGKSLAEMSHHMTLEQKLLVMKQVSEGVHEAHRSGLIHRDLKPGNIMVEPTETGSYKAYVLDFGVARFGGDEKLTMVGSVLGTPAYMSPEQARGEVDLLDRRTDVYTLYHLLVGHPPFTGAGQATVLHEILVKEVVRPRQIRMGIPSDVETIALKCLEKEREARYDSARALADDLGRYLDGDPIEARAAGVLYRMRKWIKRNKAVFAMGLAAVVLVIGSLSWGLWRSARREELARNLTAHVKEIEAIARYSALSRAHDIRPDRKRMHRHMDQIRAEMDKSGKMGRGPGNYALGWSYLMLGEPENARRHLDQAHAAGLRTPQLAYALGMCYSTLYRNALQAARLIPDKQDRQEKITQLASRLRDPALEFMRQAGGAEQAVPGFLKANIAMFENRYDDALAILSQSGDGDSWFYEAQSLKAGIYREKALAAEAGGQKETAFALFEEALEAYDTAAHIAESDPDIYRNKLLAILQIISIRINEDANLDTLSRRADQTLGRIREVLPQDGETLLLEADYLRLLCDHARVHGKDPSDLFEKAVAAAVAAKAHLVEKWRAEFSLVRTYRQWSYWLMQQGKNPGEILEKTMDAASRVPEQHRDFKFYLDLGKSWQYLARLEQQCAHYDRAIPALERAVALSERRLEGYYQLGDCLYQKASGPCAGDRVKQLLEEAATALEQAIDSNPTHFGPQFLAGKIQLTLAQDGDPKMGRYIPEHAEKARSYFRKVLDLYPEQARFYAPLLNVLLVQARGELERGQDAGPYFEEALSIAEKGLGLDSQSQNLIITAAFIHYYRGKYLVRSGMPPAEHFEEALDLLDQITHPALESCAGITRGSVWRLLAERALITEDNPGVAIGKAMRSFQAVLATNPDNAEAYRSLGLLTMIEALDRISHQGNASSTLQQAAAYMDRALELEGASPYFHLAKARLLLLEAALCDDPLQLAQKLADGRSWLAKARVVRPDFADLTTLAHCFDVVEANRDQQRQDAVSRLFAESSRVEPAPNDWWRIYLPGH